MVVRPTSNRSGSCLATPAVMSSSGRCSPCATVCVWYNPGVSVVGWLGVIVIGTAAIVWGAEVFAEHLADASKRLGVTAFALALLLAGAEPEELATVVTASARGVDGVAFGDVIGANAAIVTIALGTGAFITVLPFGQSIRRYALGGLATGLLAAGMIWDGAVSRLEGLALVAAYVVFVGAIWVLERRPPSLGEAAELDEPIDASGRVGRDLGYVVVGLVALTVGSMALVEGVRRLTDVEATQTRLGLTIVGLATAFELVVLAFSASRHGITDAVVAGVIGSYAYNMTMSLGVGAIVAPIGINDASLLHPPTIVMLGLLAVVILLASRHGSLGRRESIVLVAGYPLFLIIVAST